ncbi:MAG: type toxin-antitoxin system RelE/ParE family toxin [Acidobacteria bacterium]|nr:type toxin-antitoxin system RelE/ParE family toxin [Acidobacteriota bacterium]
MARPAVAKVMRSPPSELRLVLQPAILVAIMSDVTYDRFVTANDRPLVWMHAEVKSPPFSIEARLEAGFLLRKLQKCQKLEMPHSRPMPAIGERCHELRIVDIDATWRIIYRVDPDAIVIADVFSKKSRTTPKSVIDRSKKRLREYDNA